MPQLPLEERVAALERQVAEIKGSLQSGIGKKNWRRTVGMFSGDEAMKRIDEEGRKWREAERRKARRKQVKNRRPRP
jgi:hypothetical protein